MHPNLRYLFVTAINDSFIDMGCIDLGLKRKQIGDDDDEDEESEQTLKEDQLTVREQAILWYI